MIGLGDAAALANIADCGAFVSPDARALRDQIENGVPFLLAWIGAVYGFNAAVVVVVDAG